MSAPFPGLNSKLYGDSDRDLQFTCPKCGGHEFTSDKRGDGSDEGDYFPKWGHCSDPNFVRCMFLWNRDEDDRLYFAKRAPDQVSAQQRRIVRFAMIEAHLKKLEIESAQEAGKSLLCEYTMDAMMRSDFELAKQPVTQQEIKKVWKNNKKHLFEFNGDSESEYMVRSTIDVALRFSDRLGRAHSWRHPSVFLTQGNGLIDNPRGYYKLLCQGYIFEEVDPQWNKPGRPEDKKIMIFPTKLLLQRLQQYFQRQAKK